MGDVAVVCARARPSGRHRFSDAPAIRQVGRTGLGERRPAARRACVTGPLGCGGADCRGRDSSLTATRDPHADAGAPRGGTRCAGRAEGGTRAPRTRRARGSFCGAPARRAPECRGPAAALRRGASVDRTDGAVAGALFGVGDGVDAERCRPVVPRFPTRRVIGGSSCGSASGRRAPHRRARRLVACRRGRRKRCADPGGCPRYGAAPIRLHRARADAARERHPPRPLGSDSRP